MSVVEGSSLRGRLGPGAQRCLPSFVRLTDGEWAGLQRKVSKHSMRVFTYDYFTHQRADRQTRRPAVPLLAVCLPLAIRLAYEYLGLQNAWFLSACRRSSRCHFARPPVSEVFECSVAPVSRISFLGVNFPSDRLG